MKVDVFSQSMTRSDDVLKRHGVRLLDLLMNANETTFGNVLNSFVGLVAIQVCTPLSRIELCLLFLCFQGIADGKVLLLGKRTGR